jgi:F0F1-type ATP synthase beta subunit
VPIETTVSDVAAILDGSCDRRGERELFMIGSLDDLGEESSGG